MLVPTIGLVQVGFQSIADRYTYIPSIGIFVALVWAVAEMVGSVEISSALARPRGDSGADGLRLSDLDSGWVLAQRFTLWTQCLAVDSDNVIAHYNLGYVLQFSNRTDRPLSITGRRCVSSRTISNPNLALGVVLLGRGGPRRLPITWQRRCASNPTTGRAHANLGVGFGRLGRMECCPGTL